MDVADADEVFPGSTSPAMCTGVEGQSPRGLWIFCAVAKYRSKNTDKVALINK